MSVIPLLKCLSLLRFYCLPGRVPLWPTALCQLLRQLPGLLFGIVARILCRIKLGRPRPRPPGDTHKGLGRHHDQGAPPPFFPSYELSLDTDGAIVPLNEGLFSINPTSAGDSFRNSSSVGLSLPNRQHGSRSSLRLSSKSMASSKSPNSRVPSPLASPALSTSSLPLCPPDLQESPYLYRRESRPQPPRRHDTRPIDIEIVQAPDDSPTTADIPGVPALPNEPPYLGPTQLSTATLQVPDRRTPQIEQSPSRPYNVTSALSLPESAAKNYGLTPAIPSETLRYKSRSKIEKKKTNIIIMPQDCTAKRFIRGLDLPHGWKRHVHPEGGWYFSYSSQTRKRIFTDNEIYHPEELRRIEAKMNEVDTLKGTIDDFPPDADIVLNINKVTAEDGSTDYETQCYCVNHTDRMIFFLTEFHAEWMDTWEEVVGAYSRHHLRHEIEAQYWNFVHLYPDSIKLSKQVIDDVKDALFFFTGDVTTSSYSTSPYNSAEISNLLNLLPMLEGHINSETSTAGGVECIARIMFLICHNRFLNFYGEPCARLERDFSVYGDALFPRTLMLRSVSLFLFSAPDVHLRSLQKMWADKILHKGIWKNIMTTFTSEWQELVTYSTIMLNANVAFLAIQSVDKDPPSRSWAQIFSYASTVANLACMILSLLLMRQNKTKPRETTDHVIKYLEKQYSELTGLEALAIMFSLPYVSLMWGMVSFLVAFSLMCVSRANKETRIIVIICLVLATIWIIWCIQIAWENNPKDTSQDNRVLAYSQQAEIERAKKDEKGPYGSGTGDVPLSASRPPRQIPGVDSITSLWNAFLCIFIRSGEEREQDIELRGIRVQAPDSSSTT